VRRMALAWEGTSHSMQARTRSGRAAMPPLGSLTPPAATRAGLAAPRRDGVAPAPAPPTTGSTGGRGRPRQRRRRGRLRPRLHALRRDSHPRSGQTLGGGDSAPSGGHRGSRELGVSPPSLSSLPPPRSRGERKEERSRAWREEARRRPAAARRPSARGALSAPIPSQRRRPSPHHLPRLRHPARRRRVGRPVRAAARGRRARRAEASDVPARRRAGRLFPRRFDGRREGDRRRVVGKRGAAGAFVPTTHPSVSLPSSFRAAKSRA